ncbi:aminotransferase class V-fold PLP-dependent enzyme [Eubacterium sp. 1001713B170207_170306_E7]|uniref:pyridoxal-phosphate-dependent aminotransferase family protein n=1 Tax=Eubacterium sp. 1001713B170207_170306_E7 TaxID=2787097 RepID=UPI001A9C190B|nr:aminotransferase class V-fold PLP-dependent enzyme [Eubacterium sp. 1001713B170207_170306_E7]
MKLFTIGPTEMYKNTLEVKAQMVPYFRTKEFSDLMLETDSLLKKSVGTTEASKSIYLTASGSGAMEATAMNCFDQNDKLLVISGGTFGERFEDICRIHFFNYEVLKIEFGQTLTQEMLIPFEDKGFTGLLVNLHETSTGQLYDIEMLSEFCQRNQLFLVVDAITVFLCDPYNMDRYHIDATIISSQKGLCLSPGLSMVILSKRMVEKVYQSKVSSLYFDFRDYIKNMERGQTPFTPCVGILYELNDMLKKIDQESIERHLNRVRALCENFRESIKNLPISIPDYPLSNGMTPIIFEKPIAKELFESLKNQYGIYVNPTGGKLKERLVRIAHIGNLTIEDNQMLIEHLKVFL